MAIFFQRYCLQFFFSRLYFLESVISRNTNGKALVLRWFLLHRRLIERTEVSDLAVRQRISKKDSKRTDYRWWKSRGKPLLVKYPFDSPTATSHISEMANFWKFLKSQSFEIKEILCELCGVWSPPENRKPASTRQHEQFSQRLISTVDFTVHYR